VLQSSPPPPIHKQHQQKRRENSIEDARAKKAGKCQLKRHFVDFAACRWQNTGLIRLTKHEIFDIKGYKEEVW